MKRERIAPEVGCAETLVAPAPPTVTLRPHGRSSGESTRRNSVLAEGMRPAKVSTWRPEVRETARHNFRDTSDRPNAQ